MERHRAVLAANEQRLEQRSTETPASCWNEIGLYGNGSCPKLEEYVHCRNCPVYSGAALELLNRLTPVGYEAELEARFSTPPQLKEANRTAAVLFRLDNDWLALPARAFQEICERKQIHSLPHRRKSLVLGLANVRGELVVCISLARLLGWDSLARGDGLAKRHQRLMVTNWEGTHLGIPVDEVQGLHWFQPDELQAPSATKSRSHTNYIKHILDWNQRIVGVLEPRTLFPILNRSLA